jgi:hypothetical protein
MTKPILAGLALLLLFSPSYSQQRVNPRNTHERLLCVVSMVGSGTADDPRRPMFAPLPPGPYEKRTLDGIIAFAYQESDDGRYALVEFVARDRAAFKPVLDEADRRADVKAFVKGKANRADIET